MALDATPTSGAGPYVITWDVANKASFNTGYFTVNVRTIQSAGTCPSGVIEGGNRLPDANSLLTNDQFTFTTAVPPGSCRNFSVLIIDNRSSEVVSQQFVLISNL